MPEADIMVGRDRCAVGPAPRADLVGHRYQASRRKSGTDAASFAFGPSARRSAGTVATHKHPIQAAMLAVIVIEAGFMQ
jgi:hypothetical protein